MRCASTTRRPPRSTRLPRRLGAIAELLKAGPETAARDRRAEPDLAKAVGDADFVIEAAPENLALKQDLFAEARRACAGRTRCSRATRRSSRSGASRERVRDKTRVVGTHFWNPPHLVPLVEVVTMERENLPRGRAHDRLARLARPQAGAGQARHSRLHRQPPAACAEARGDRAGGGGVCDAETLDEVVKLGFGARLAVLGPLEQSDLVGLDLTKAIHETVMPDLDVTRTPHPYLEALVAKGDLGMKSGKGFRDWTPEQAEAVRARLSAFLRDQAKKT